jgi:phosphoribosylamine-glycine ligase
VGVHFQTIDEALESVQKSLEQDGVVLLETMIGEEFSRMAFVEDGKIMGMPVARTLNMPTMVQGERTGGWALTAWRRLDAFVSQRMGLQGSRLLCKSGDAIERDRRRYRGFCMANSLPAHGVG